MLAVASLVLGIISVAFCWIPFCGTWAIVPAIVGLILGTIDMNKLKKAGRPRGTAIAGFVLNIVAIAVIIIWIIIIGGIIASEL